MLLLVSKVYTPHKESITDLTVRKAALNFLKKKNFHQILRNEILFTVAPRTLKSNTTQTNRVLGVMKSLRFGGFLRDEGFKQLGTIVQLIKIIGHELQLTLNDSTVDAFCQSGESVLS